MIRIVCTSCKNTLTMDDAFAGGVCRCQHCGTIQTVPAKGAKAAAMAGQSTKALFEKKTRPGGSGLDDLADIISSSGLTDKRLRKAPAQPPIKKNMMLLMGVGGGVLALLVITLIILLVHGSNQSAAPSNGASAPPTATPELGPPVAGEPPPAVVAASGPNFCGITLGGDTIVYLIDNGSSAEQTIDATKTATLKSIASLGNARKFQILFWNIDDPGFPPGQRAIAANRDNTDSARKAIDSVEASGSTDPVNAVAQAVKADPDEIVLITAKGGDLDPPLIAQVMTARGKSHAKIVCVGINDAPDDAVMQAIAHQSGGSFVPLPETQLRSFAE